MRNLRCRILKHEQLEELCVLAASAEIEPTDLEQVRAHLQECEACRSLFVQIGEIHSQHLSTLPSSGRELSPAQESLNKDLILAAARNEGLRFEGPQEREIPYEKPRIEFI